MSSDLTAEDIVEELLYRTSKALKSDDSKGVETCFVIPQYMETLLGSRLIESEEALLQVFASVRKYFKENCVTDVVRTVVSAEFLDADTVGATHVSRLIQRDGELFRSPYPVYSIIRRVDSGWKVASTSYAILDAPEHNKALNPAMDIDTAAFGDKPKK